MTKPAETAGAANEGASGSKPASSTFRGWIARGLWIAAGAGMLAGFFLPWINIGESAAVTGLGLLATEGDVVDMVTGPHKLLLIAVPSLGVAMIVAGATGHRIAALVALVASGTVILGGLYTLIRLFFSATGTGMWLVVGSALVALVVSLLVLGGEKR